MQPAAAVLLGRIFGSMGIEAQDVSRGAAGAAGPESGGVRRSIPDACDTVVIGAGIGGLTAGALLAKAGLSVCVIDKQARAGGCACGFDRGEFRFETAVHWLNQCGPGGLVRRVFDYIGNAPPTAPNRRIRRFVGDSHDYLLDVNPDGLRNRLTSDFPGQRGGIERFFASAKSIRGAFDRLGYLTRAPESMPPWERGARLLAATAAAWPLIGNLPFSADFGLRTLYRSPALGDVFRTEERLLSCLVPVAWAYGDDYQLPPEGGCRSFASWLCSAIESGGGVVALGTEVKGILTEGGQVRAVRTGCGRSVKTPYVIAACDIAGVLGMLLEPGTVPKRRLAMINDADIYNSCVTISLGLGCSPRQWGLGEELVILTRDGVGRRDQGCGDPELTEINVIASSSRDPSLAPAGKGVLSLYAPVSLRYGDTWRAGRGPGGTLVRGADYRAFKERYADTIITRVEQRLCPGLRSHIEVRDVATPLTYLRYTGNKNGAIMGFRPTFRNIRGRVARPTTPVKNLFVGGQWAAFGGGVPQAVKAGANSALLVLRREMPEAFGEMSGILDTVA